MKLVAKIQLVNSPYTYMTLQKFLCVIFKVIAYSCMGTCIHDDRSGISAQVHHRYSFVQSK